MSDSCNYDNRITDIKCRLDPDMARQLEVAMINLNPSWQRKYEAWNDEWRTQLIEVILDGQTINPIWTIDNDDEDCEDVLDGMHRLTTIFKYLNNEFALNKKYFLDKARNEKNHNCKFEDLTKETQKKFKDYKLSFNKLDTSYHHNSDKRHQKWKQLNQNAAPLNHFEYNKGLFVNFYNAITPHKDYYTEKLFFHKKDNRGAIEMKVIEIYILSNILPNNWSSISNMIDKFCTEEIGETTEFINIYLEKEKQNIEKKVEFTKKVITTLYNEQIFATDKSIYKSYFIIYQILIGRLVYFFTKDNNPNPTKLFNRHCQDIIKIMNKTFFEVEISALLNRYDLQTRNSQFQKNLCNDIDELIQDICTRTAGPRCFARSIIDKKLKEQDNKCVMCKEEKNGGWEGDHILEWSRGGTTTYDNLQVLCTFCHQNKTRNMVMGMG